MFSNLPYETVGIFLGSFIILYFGNTVLGIQANKLKGLKEDAHSTMIAWSNSFLMILGGATLGDHRVIIPAIGVQLFFLFKQKYIQDLIGKNKDDDFHANLEAEECLSEDA